MKITGTTVSTPMPRSDWDQNDPRKADYIKNKPDLSEYSKKTDTHIQIITWEEDD